MRKRTTEMKELELGMDRRDFLKKTAQFAGMSLLPNVFGCSSDSASREHDARWWVEGPYAPLTQEATDIPTLIEGSLPNWLNGTYLRNGPNRHANHHFLLGDGVVHAVSFRNGEAHLYQSRFVDTPRLGEGIIRPPSLRDHYSNIGLVFHHGRLMSLGETGLPFELDPAASQQSALTILGVPLTRRLPVIQKSTRSPVNWFSWIQLCSASADVLDG